MASINGVNNTLLEKLRKAVHDNLTNDQFGVEALAREIGMSRSQLHRRLHNATGQSVTQFIREYRLQLAMEMLRQGELTAAEVADRVGFGSATYFNKCFHAYYGFPPGEAKTRAGDVANTNTVVNIHRADNGVRNEARRSLFVIITVAVAASILAGWIGFTVSERVERRIAGSMEGEIAREVATQLNAERSFDGKSNLSASRTKNRKAYDLYLKAAYEYRTYTNNGAHNAIELLQQVIAMDSGYASAYALMASSYNGLATIFGAELHALEALERGKEFIDKALILDPNLDQAHMLMGFYHLYHDWDFDGAETSYKRALDSGHPDAIALFIDYLNFMSRHEEALVWAERLNRRDPYYPNSRLVQTYVFNGRFEEAMDFSESRLKMFTNYLTFDAHGFLLLNIGRYTEAIAYFEKAIALEGIRYPRMLGWMGAAYARAGEPRKARAIIRELKGRLVRDEKGSIAFFIAVIFSALNDKEAALSWLNTAYGSHDMEIPWLMTEPQFYNLHSEPEFRKLASRIGFL